jgi:hypothetical protein
MFCILTHPIDNPKTLKYVMRFDGEGYQIRKFDTKMAAEQYMKELNENRVDFDLDILDYVIQKVS